MSATTTASNPTLDAALAIDTGQPLHEVARDFVADRAASRYLSGYAREVIDLYAEDPGAERLFVIADNSGYSEDVDGVDEMVRAILRTNNVLV